MLSPEASLDVLSGRDSFKESIAKDALFSGLPLLEWLS
jgi:hypothetical protein